MEMVVYLDLESEEVLDHGSMYGLLKRSVSVRLGDGVDLAHASAQEQVCLIL